MTAQQENEPPAGGACAATGAEGAANAESAAVSDDLEKLRRELEEVTRKGQEYLAIAQRAQADLVNYRRRVEQERGESLRAGKAELALRILPVLDDFDRALKVQPASPETSPLAAWAQGIEPIARKLRAALEAEGITRIEAEGRDFDPWQHEAVHHQASDAALAGKVIALYRDGYRLGGRVLRAAQVIVGKGPD